jgi:hypothetical protein
MNGWTDLASFFLLFVIVRIRFLGKEKLENSLKTESALLYGIFV